MQADTEITAYKAFDANLKCRGFQYEVGSTYEHSGAVSVCNEGFHACRNPLDVLNYYDLCGARFARVKLGGSISEHDDDTKVAAGRITIEAELKLPDFIKAAVESIFALAKVKRKDKVAQSASGNSSQLAASGYSSQLAASGYSSKLAASGYSSQLEISGANSAAAAVGNGSRIKAAAGSPVAICEYDGAGKPIGFATGVAGKDFPADVWVIASNGKLVEA